MDILSKKLDKAVTQGIIQPHPLCVAPAISHLSFADDMLIFFDGSETSLQGILLTLKEFHSDSGLGINLLKSSLLLDGNNPSHTSLLANTYGLQQGSLPIRYLGLPLLPHKLRESDYQPLIERVRNRLSSWMVKHLSFAGRLQLLKSVIYSIINFWSTTFILPNGCLKGIEKMCNSFLWSGAPSGARGAKISWESSCTPKEYGGLGLRRLNEWNKIFGLKLIWMICTKRDSLWVSWIRRHLIGDRNFWTATYHNNGSWIWKRITKLRLLARTFIFCKPGNGESCSFWHDNWTQLGPLYNITGLEGPRFSGIRSSATLAEAAVNGHWSLSSSRSPIISLLRACLPATSPAIPGNSQDEFYWCTNRENPEFTVSTSAFSSSRTWSALQSYTSRVTWHSNVWFSKHIPKHAFITWIMMRNRLPTRDRLTSWGLDVPPTCLLCNSANETRNHLFFDCSFSKELWDLTLGSSTTVSASPDHQPQRLFTAPCSPQLRLIKKLLYQAMIYLLWKERNSRIHTSVSRSPTSIHKEIDGIMRSKLISIPTPLLNGVKGDSYLFTWFSYPLRQHDSGSQTSSILATQQQPSISSISGNNNNRQ